MAVDEHRGDGPRVGEHCSHLGGHHRIGHTDELATDATGVGDRSEEVEHAGHAELAADRRGVAHRRMEPGGDHSITLPLLQVYRKVLARPVAVIHFDAHCDTWSDHFGEPSGHGTWVYEAIQQGLVVPECFTQIGIRSAGLREARDYVRQQGGQIFTARDLRGRESATQLAEVLGAIRGRQAQHGNPPVYLSLDIDCLDPAFAPGTGTPEPGGLTTSQVLSLLEELADLPFIGMDCVEVSPPYDHSELTSNAAANFVWTYLAGQCARRPSNPR